MDGAEVLAWLKTPVAGISPADQHNLEKMLSSHGPKYREMRDAIHGDMLIHPVCNAFIKTKPFHRLHKIKQLGAGETFKIFFTIFNTCLTKTVEKVIMNSLNTISLK